MSFLAGLLVALPIAIMLLHVDPIEDVQRTQDKQVADKLTELLTTEMTRWRAK